MAKVCRRTGKANYRSETEARAMLARIAARPQTVMRRHIKVETECHRCPHCPYWHLTSQERNRSEKGADA